jgi:hypothetical protein
MIGVYVFYAALFEGKGLKGVVPLVDYYLRYSSVIGIAIILVTLLLPFFNFELVREVLGPLVGIEIAAITFAIIISFTGTGLIIDGYKKALQSQRFLQVAEEYQEAEHCCGWTDEALASHARKCEGHVMCSRTLADCFVGKGALICRCLLALAFFLDIYALFGKILTLSVRKGDYNRLVSTGTPVTSA